MFIYFLTEINVNNNASKDNINDINNVNNILKEEEITKIIVNWQKERIEDFYFNGKFKTSMVISHRKKIEGKTLEQARNILLQLGVYINDDFSIGIIEHTKEKTRQEKNEDEIRTQLELCHRKIHELKYLYE